jgi:tetratricopeptide (TPR) repeat protein
MRRLAGQPVLRLLPWLVAIVSFVAFLQALQAGFVKWDDDHNIVNNPNFRGVGSPQLRWMLTTTLLGHWIPLTWLSFGVNYVLGGMDPWGYHLGNLLLHAINAALFFLVARRLIAAASGRTPGDMRAWVPGASGAAMAALVFGIHPLRVESVAWVTERRDVLCGMFYLLAVLAYLKATEGGGPSKPPWRLVSLAAFVAALLSKAMAMTLPGVLLLLDVYPLRRQQLGWRALLREKDAYLVLAALGAVAAVMALRRGVPITSYETQGLPARLAMVAYSVWFYPWKWLWPSDLSPLYQLPERVDPFEWRFVFAAVLVVGVTALLVALRHRWPAGLAAWVYSAMVLAPVSGIVHAGHQLAHDRYSYLSGLGFAALAGGALTWLLAKREQERIGRRAGWLAGGMAILVLAALGVATWQQTRIWRDSESLWRAALAQEPNCVVCLNNLGLFFFEEKRFTEAEPVLRQAMALHPRRVRGHSDLGGQHAKADAALREAIRLALGHALKNRGTEAARARELTQAVNLFREASELLGTDPEAYRNLGQALLEHGQPREAVEALSQAVALDPRSAPTRFWLGQAYALTGDPELARQEITALRGLDPDAAGHLERLLADRSAPARMGSGLGKGHRGNSPER